MIYANGDVSVARRILLGICAGMVFRDLDSPEATALRQQIKKSSVLYQQVFLWPASLPASAG